MRTIEPSSIATTPMKTGLASRLLGLELQPPPPSPPAGASPEEDAEAVAEVVPDDDVPAEPLVLLVALELLAPLELLELALEAEAACASPRRGSPR